MRHVTARFFALTAASALAVASAAEPAVTVPPEPAGMTVLFNGRDLSGWDGDPRLWSVRDGVIHGETTVEQPAAGNTFLICEGDPVRDFELRLSFRCTATNNSGIQYRSVRVDEASARNRWVVRGYQHELRNEERFPNVPGFIYDEGGLAGGRGRIVRDPAGPRSYQPGQGTRASRRPLRSPAIATGYQVASCSRRSRSATEPPSSSTSLYVTT